MIYEPIQVFEGNGINPEILEVSPEFSNTISIDGDLGTPCNYFGCSENYLEISHRDGYLEKFFADKFEEMREPLKVSGNKPFKFKVLISNIDCLFLKYLIFTMSSSCVIAKIKKSAQRLR